MNIILFLVILAVLVLSHELGHLVVAKRVGMRVDEFGFGFPPRLFSWRRGETDYSVNAIPFGGFVKIFGENPSPAVALSPDRERSFTARPKLAQAAVLVAGVTFNWLLAWLLISVSFMNGLPLSTSFFDRSIEAAKAKLIITEVLPDSPAAEAKLPVGSQILSLREGGTVLNNPGVVEMQEFIGQRAGRAVEIEYWPQPDLGARPETKAPPVGVKTIVVPRELAVAGKVAIGTGLDLVVLVKEPIYKAPITALVFTSRLTGYTVKAMGGFFKELLVGNRRQALAGVTGPIGLIGLVGEANNLGFVYLLTFIALISINLAVINLIPFPALDGGRLLFLAIEAVKGSPLKPRVANMANAIGFALLIFLMLLVTYKDIAHLVAK